MCQIVTNYKQYTDGNCIASENERKEKNISFTVIKMTVKVILSMTEENVIHCMKYCTLYSIKPHITCNVVSLTEKYKEQGNP